MNKTVNINLAGTFFHIDEDAYQKLQRYLDAIKRSFTDSQGRSEILADIEARIAELFTERVKHDKQVISTKEVEEVIAIMGQPEDYLVDDEIFEDEPTTSPRSKSIKKLYRDTSNSYIGGVASGLGHYLGLDAIWIRLIWVLLALGSMGTFVLIYILFWILVPEALTTAEKLTMTGEPVNISNIEKKIKKGFEGVSDTVKNVDYEKYGSKVKSTSKSFFDTIGDIIMFFLKLFAKFIGVLLVLFSALSIFALLISVLSLGSSSFFHPWWMDYPDAVNTTGLPIWLGSLLVFFTVGIPCFFVLYLGLKILINNLKSIGKPAKFTLLGIWLISLIGLITIGIKQASDHALDSVVTQKDTLLYNTKDTLQISMVKNNKFNRNLRRSSDFKIVYNDNDQKVIFSRDVALYIRSTKDSVAMIQIEKESKGKNYLEAKDRAEKIVYNYTLKNNQLLLDSYLLTDYKNKYREQKVDIILYLPEGTYVDLNRNLRSFLPAYNSVDNIITYKNSNHIMKILNDDATCVDCTEAEDDEDFNNNNIIDVNINDENGSLKINSEGVSIKNDNVDIQIGHTGVKANSSEVKVDIGENGINITSDEDN
ncbi:PspC domain-containing protein [Formosa sediminum]|uniref:PspC domain-containing protein n=1 Tax=Formosa sediminum TaxID=2594004 RepID=A0A516GS28_9FLAO|nr:PspC domain-containing protein [Formosa sediminum]QDO94327.1 PspC domain-containing protein [Formosa sediminum]